MLVINDDDMHEWLVFRVPVSVPFPIFFLCLHFSSTRLFISNSNSLFHNQIIVNLVSLFIEEIGDVPCWVLWIRFYGVFIGSGFGHSSLKTILRAIYLRSLGASTSVTLLFMSGIIVFVIYGLLYT